MDAAPGEWGDLDVEDVGEGPLVLRLPRGFDVADETRVERVGDEVPLGVVLGLALVEDDEIENKHKNMLALAAEKGGPAEKEALNKFIELITISNLKALAPHPATGE